jgi:hypothetical protein
MRLLVLICVLLLFSTIGSAQEPVQDCIQIYERYEPVGFIQIRVFNLNTGELSFPEQPLPIRSVTSPDGRYRAFLYPAFADDQFNLDNSTFYILDLQTGELTPIQTGVLDNLLIYSVDMAWSPDGSRVALHGVEGEQDYLLVTRPDGSDLIRGDIYNDVGALRWSEDGLLLAIVDTESRQAVYDSQTLERVKARIPVEPETAPTEESLLGYIGEDWQVRLERADTYRVTLENPAAGENRVLLEIQDGGFFDLYQHAPFAAIAHYGGSDEDDGLYVFSLDSEDVQFIHWAYQPTWSSDGTRLAYRRFETPESPDYPVLLEVLATSDLSVTHSVTLNNEGQFWGEFIWANCERGY